MTDLNTLGLDRNLYKAPLDGQTWDADTIADNLDQIALDAVAVTTGGAAADINNGSVTVDGTQLTPGSAIPQSAFAIAQLGWTQTMVFSASGANTIRWDGPGGANTPGTFTSSSGVSYAISAGNTGTMAAITYIYLNTDVSTTQYQVTTNQADVIGPNRVLIAVAQNQTATATFNTVQTSLITANNIFVNTLSSISANMGTITAGSINISNLSFIASNGYATFIGVSTLNKKAYTNFEAAGRFVNTTTAGVTIAPVYGNQGVTLATTATASRYTRVLWYINNVYTNNPTFTFTLTANALNAATGDSAAFIGLGDPGVSETGYSPVSKSFLGVNIRKSGGTVNVGSMMNNGNADGGVGANFTTISDSDSLEVFTKNDGTTVKWYYRKNGGTLALGDSQTTRIPTGSGEQNVHFSATNMGTAADFNLIMQCAAYEH